MWVYFCDLWFVICIWILNWFHHCNLMCSDAWRRKTRGVPSFMCGLWGNWVVWWNMSCTAVTACQLAVNFKNIYHSSSVPSMLWVTPTHINRFPETYLKLASSGSTYWYRAPFCLFGDKGKSENPNKVKGLLEIHCFCCCINFIIEWDVFK